MQDPLILTVNSKDSIILIVYIHRFSKSTFGKFSWLCHSNTDNLCLVNAIKILLYEPYKRTCALSLSLHHNGFLE